MFSVFKLLIIGIASLSSLAHTSSVAMEISLMMWWTPLVVVVVIGAGVVVVVSTIMMPME